MNISKVYRLLVLFIILTSFAFILQFYVNSKKHLIAAQENFKVAIFLNDIQVDENEIIDIINQKNIVKSVEYIDKESAYQKALELSPELNDIVGDKEISYPSYIVMKNFIDINKINFENLINEISSLECVEDVCYDKVSFDRLCDNIKLLNIYFYIFIILLVLALIIYTLKFVMFFIKQEYKKICVNIIEALIVTVISYVLICFCTVIESNSVFVLNWEILYVLFPISIIINFINIQPNVKD